MIDTLIERIKEKKNPVCVGLDTNLSFLRKEDFSGDDTNPLKYAGENIWRFNKSLIDELCDIIPSVKVQAAYYEMYGFYGMEAYYKTLEYAKEKGLVTIADVKRNDIGSTASAYSAAYLGKTDVCGKNVGVFGADFVTVNGYLGSDGVLPFAEDCKKYDKGIFVLVKTSNKSSGELQDMVCEGKTVYEHMADMTEKWGAELVGKYGYSDVGAVVGATYPKQAEKLRADHKNMFFLIPGYGAQGATAQDIMPNFDKKGLGGVVNSSRGILAAYKKEKYAGMTPTRAARAATLDMQKDILTTFEKNEIDF